MMMGGVFAGHDENPGEIVEKVIQCPGAPNMVKKYKVCGVRLSQGNVSVRSRGFAAPRWLG